jgi:hypothetical protein
VNSPAGIANVAVWLLRSARLTVTRP